MVPNGHKKSTISKGRDDKSAVMCTRAQMKANHNRTLGTNVKQIDAYESASTCQIVLVVMTWSTNVINIQTL